MPDPGVFGDQGFGSAGSEEWAMVSPGRNSLAGNTVLS